MSRHKTPTKLIGSYWLVDEEFCVYGTSGQDDVVEEIVFRIALPKVIKKS